MGATHAPNTCPCCGDKSSSRAHLQKHGRHGELVQRMVPEGKDWVMAWLTPQQAKEMVA